jgi:hypothetical protein
MPGSVVVNLPHNLKQIDKMLEELMAPRFTYVMARGRLAACLRAGKQGDAMYRGAHAAMLSSAKEIHRIVMKYRALPMTAIDVKVVHEED